MSLSLCVESGCRGILEPWEAVQSLLQEPRFETIEHRTRVKAAGVEMKEWIVEMFERKSCLIS